MKNLIAKLKNVDYKRVALEHGEKIGFGVVALIVVIALAGTTWFGYAKTPKEMEDKAASSARNLVASDWPEEKRKEFAPSTYLAQAKLIVTGITGPDRLSYSGPFWSPLYPLKQPIEEPRIPPVEHPIADAGRVIVEVRPLSPSGGSANSNPDIAAAPVPVITEFIRPDQQIAAKAAAPGLRGGVPPPDPTGVLPPGGEGSAAAAATGRGLRFVSVRAIFNLKKTVDSYAKALHAESASEVQDLVELVDFQIERRRAVAGPELWGEWEPVNVQTALDVVAESDYDTEVVETGVTDPVITMPLPRRWYGIWADRATHPDLKNVQLTPEEMEAQRVLNERIREEYEKSRHADEQAKVEKKGFSRDVIDIRRMQREVLKNKRPEDLLRGPGGPPGGPAGFGNRPVVSTQPTAAGRLLLFRYLDFDVEPGEAYQYRIKLILQNPNFGKDLADVVDPSVAAGLTRETEWSEPTPAVVVEDDVDFYLVDVEHRKKDQGTAYVQMFQWVPAFGTFIKDQLPVAFGQFVGGNKKSLRLNVWEPALTEAEVEFNSPSVLVDSRFSPQVVIAEHPDLNLAATAKSRPEKIGIAEQAVVVNRYGEIVRYDTVSQVDARLRKDQYVEQERRPFLNETGDKDKGGTELDKLVNKKKGANDKETTKGPTRNPLKKIR